ncbi:MAG TPA: hypothetical protein V6D33_12675 [Cyanophyceae cyanobacterium]
MAQLQSQFNSWIIQELLTGAGQIPRPDLSKSFVALCDSRSGTTAFRWDAASLLTTVVATELPESNGYTRAALRHSNYRPITIDIATGTLTISGGHPFNNGDAVFVFTADGSVPMFPLELATTYFVRDSNQGAGTLKLATTNGGSAIAYLNSSSVQHFIAYAGAFNTTTREYTTAADSVLFQAGTTSPGLSYTDAVLICDTSAWANRVVTFATGTTGLITCASPHSMAVKDRVFFTADSGSLPTATRSLASNQLFQVLSVPSSTTFTITVDGVTPITFSTTGSGTLRVRNGSGKAVSFLREEADASLIATNLPKIIAPSTYRQFTFSRKNKAL